MNSCSDHKIDYYGSDQCPVCEALAERDHYKEELEYAHAIIQDLRERLGLF